MTQCLEGSVHTFGIHSVFLCNLSGTSNDRDPEKLLLCYKWTRCGTACSHGRGSLSMMINFPCHGEQIPKDTAGGIHHWCRSRLIPSPSGADAGNYTAEGQHGIHSLQTTRNNAAGSSIRGGALFISYKFGLLINSGRGTPLMLPCCPLVVVELRTVNRGNMWGP